MTCHLPDKWTSPEVASKIAPYRGRGGDLNELVTTNAIMLTIQAGAAGVAAWAWRVKRPHMAAGPRAVLTAAAVTLGAAMAMTAAALLLTAPDLRGVAAVVALAGLGFAAWRTVQRRGRTTLTADAGWTVVTAPPPAPAAAPAASQWASATVRNIEAMEVTP